MAGYRCLVGLILLCLAVATAGGAVSASAVREWYPTLIHPAFAPPNWVFGPVWTILYVMMAVAAWRAWRKDHFSRDSVPLRLFLSQLALNCAWSFIFFGFHQIGLAVVDIVALLVAILATTASFRSRDRTAAVLMLPTLAWVGFATALNLEFWRLN